MKFKINDRVLWMGIPAVITAIRDGKYRVKTEQTEEIHTELYESDLTKVEE